VIFIYFFINFLNCDSKALWKYSSECIYSYSITVYLIKYFDFCIFLVVCHCRRILSWHIENIRFRFVWKIRSKNIKYISVNSPNFVGRLRNFWSLPKTSSYLTISTKIPPKKQTKKTQILTVLPFRFTVKTFFSFFSWAVGHRGTLSSPRKNMILAKN